MNIISRDDLARLMQEKANKFSANDAGDRKFVDWTRASELLLEVGQPFAGCWAKDAEGNPEPAKYKKLKDLPLDVKQIVFNAMQELEIEKVV